MGVQDVHCIQDIVNYHQCGIFAISQLLLSPWMLRSLHHCSIPKIAAPGNVLVPICCLWACMLVYTTAHNDTRVCLCPTGAYIRGPLCSILCSSDLQTVGVTPCLHDSCLHDSVSTPENYSVLTPNTQSLAMHRKAIKDLSVLSPRVNLHTKAWCRLQRLIMMACHEKVW